MFQQQGLNNPVDKNTKIVYINSTKLPLNPCYKVSLELTVFARHIKKVYLE